MTEERFGARWGSPYAPMLPARMRETWGNEVLPDWLAQASGLPTGSNLKALDGTVWAYPGFSPGRLKTYIVRFVSSRFREIDALRALTDEWPPYLDPRNVAWAPRTVNTLQKAGLLDDATALADITFSELTDIRSMGVGSVLDFAATAEAAIGEFSAEAISGPFSADPAIGEFAKVSVDENRVQALQTLFSEALSSPWIDFVTDEDPRFSACFDKKGGSLQEAMDDFLSQVPMHNLESAVRSPGLRRQLKQLETLTTKAAALVTHIGEMSLDESLRDYVAHLAHFSDARLDALLARLGLDGYPARTLQQAADMVGLTRERMRQIQTQVGKRRPSHPVFMPKLDAAMKEIIRLSPVDCDTASVHLLQQGLSSIPFDPRSLLSASAFCGRSAPVVVVQTRAGRQVITEGVTEHVSAISAMASKQANSYGSSNVAEVVAKLAESSIEVSDEVVREALKELTSASFLTEDWFWMPEGKPRRNRLRNVTLKILSVVAPVDVAVIREGLRRQYRLYGLMVLPPRDVLLAFYDACPEFEVVSGRLIRPVRPLDSSRVLSATERILVDVLRSSPSGVLDRASFVQGCTERGMNPNTFSVYSSYSGVLEHLGIDIWALRGVAVDPAAVEAVRVANAERPRVKRTVDYGWTARGELWVALRLPRSEAKSIVALIPSGIRRYVAGSRFVAVAEDGSLAGTISVNGEGTSWGYGPFLRRRGADEGDFLRVEFDLPRAVARLSLGSAELFAEELSEPNLPP